MIARGDGDRRGGVVPIVVIAVLAGVSIGILFAWSAQHAPEAGPPGPIEWNEVQPVPKADPRPEDQEWERRAQDGPSTRSGQTVEGKTSASSTATPSI